MAYTKQLFYEPLRTIDSATFTGNYQAIGSSLAHPATLVKLVNASNVLITLSTDGVNDCDVARATSSFVYDLTANTPSNGDDAVFFPQGMQFYVKGSSGTGLVYLVVICIMQV